MLSSSKKGSMLYINILVQHFLKLQKSFPEKAFKIYSTCAHVSPACSQHEKYYSVPKCSIFLGNHAFCTHKIMCFFQFFPSKEIFKFVAKIFKKKKKLALIHYFLHAKMHNSPKGRAVWDEQRTSAVTVSSYQQEDDVPIWNKGTAIITT